MTICYLSLGANQQDPIRKLHQAIHNIALLKQTIILKQSQIIPTPAFGVTQQQHFYNMVIKLDTLIQPFLLLKHLQSIESKLGRVRKTPWGPRMIDIDILSYGDSHINHPKLTLPHPQIKTREFIHHLLQEIF